MAECPFKNRSCQKSRCEIWVENEGCSFKVIVSVLKENGKALYEAAKDHPRAAPHPTGTVGPKMRAIQEGEIERFVESLNVLEVANMPTKDVYANSFREWCRLRGLEPCSAAKLTRRVCDVWGLCVDTGFYRAIRTGAD